MFNRDVTEALNSKEPLTATNNVRDRLILLLNRLAAVVTQALLPYQYQTVVALIITLVHARDTVKELIDGQVRSTDDFAWTRCLIEELHCK